MTKFYMFYFVYQAFSRHVEYIGIDFHSNLLVHALLKEKKCLFKSINSLSERFDVKMHDIYK